MLTVIQLMLIQNMDVETERDQDESVGVMQQVDFVRNSAGLT